MIEITLTWVILTVLVSVIVFWIISFAQDATVKKILMGLAVLCLVLWILQSFGIIPAIIVFRI